MNVYVVLVANEYGSAAVEAVFEDQAKAQAYSDAIASLKQNLQTMVVERKVRK